MNSNEPNNTPNNDDQNNEPSPQVGVKRRVVCTVRHYMTGRSLFVESGDPQSGRARGTEHLGEAQDFGSVENARGFFEIMETHNWPRAEVWEVFTTTSPTGEAVQTYAKHALMHSHPRYEKAPDAPPCAPTRFDNDDDIPLAVLRHGPAVHWNAQKFGGVKFENQVLHAVDFRRATLNGVEFENCLLVGCRFGNAELNDATFENCDLLDCDFTKTEINGGTFDDCKFSGCYFRTARLEEVEIKHTIFHATTFREATILGEKMDMEGVEIFERPWAWLENATITLTEGVLDAFGIFLDDPRGTPPATSRPRVINWTTEYPALAVYLTLPPTRYTPAT